MKFFYETKGAVSIFLIIILLPVITIAGLFIDVSRVQLAKEVATSSADLALNTVMSQYDKNLNDYFGLLASCQNSKDVIDVSKNYFVDSLVSADFTTNDAEDIADKIFGSGKISDMLNLSVDGETTINRTTNGALNNPALLKKQIIEFMKYRAPVNGVASLFESLAKENIAKKAENLSKETEMTEAKKDFYEAEKKLIKQAEKAYNAIKKYREFKTSTDQKFSDEKYADDLANFLNKPNGTDASFEEIYKDAHSKLIKNLANTYDIDRNKMGFIKKGNIISFPNISKYSENNKASVDKIKELIISFNNEMISYIDKRSSLANTWGEIGQQTNNDYPLQYWVALTNNCKDEYDAYVSSANSLIRAYAKLENAVSNAEGNAMESKIKASNVSNKYVTYEKGNDLSLQSVYDTLVNKYENSYKNELENRSFSAYRTINSELNGLEGNSEISNQLKLGSVNVVYNIREKINGYYKDFETAKELVDAAKTETNKLKKKLQDYKEAFEDWDEIANDSELEDSDLAEDQRKEIQELKDTGIEKFSEESVTKLVDRLGNISTLCKIFRDDLEAIKYKSTPIKNISDYGKFRTAAGPDLNKIVRNKNDLNEYVGESFSFSIGKSIQRVIIKDNITSTKLEGNDEYIITDSFHPNINKTKFELIEWMKKQFDTPRHGMPQQFDGKTVNDEDSAEEASDTMDNKSEDTNQIDTAQNSTGKNFSVWDGATLPSKGELDSDDQDKTAKLSEVSEFTGDIFANFGETFMNSLVNMRDDLYMLDYIFGMFTYDTFEKEGCYNQLTDAQKKNLKPGAELDSKYESVKGKWKERDNRTLTLTPRNTSNNWAYGGEVEYILYGNNSNAKNKTSAYTRVFLIRYAFDVAAVFDGYWNDDFLGALALALDVFAHIPQGFTKTVACLAITAAEAAVDLKYLKNGLPVVLIKGKDDLVCSYKSVFSNSSQQSVDSSDKFALQYSDYLKIFLFIKLIGNKENNIYLRSGDVIQANIRQSQNDKLFTLEKSQIFFNFSADLLVEPKWSRLLAIDNLGDLSTSKEWRKISINMRRGY